MSTGIARVEALALADCDDLPALMAAAAEVRDRAFGDVVSYSRKVFIPLTQLCRDSCHYCTFARPPGQGEAAFLAPDEVLAIARAGAQADCHEALFTLGDKPELRYREAREALQRLGHPTTLSYLAAMAELVLRETGLLPHLNPGVMTPSDLVFLRSRAVSMGLMLEASAPRLCARGGPHFGSPDKLPAVRLATIDAAGVAAVPFTSGILIGIGETRAERVDALLALRDLAERHGHLQEVIVQNFRAKPGTRMADTAEPSFAEHLWTIAMARLVLGPATSIQAPPNLADGALARMIEAGINDWGGVSPVTPDHVNPERPWPQIDVLARATASAGKVLTERLAIYPAFARAPSRWLDPALRPIVLRITDAEGFARPGTWSPGVPGPVSGRERRESARGVPSRDRRQLHSIVARARNGESLDVDAIVALFRARGDDFAYVCEEADRLRATMSGNSIGYVVNRNINYTNVCSFRCGFCAFSKGRASEALRGHAYDLDRAEIARRVCEAWARGATEVCLQGGIHPGYTGNTYVEILRTAKEAAPDIHVHAFSPLEVLHGATTLGIGIQAFLLQLKAEGLGSLPGTAAEILDDEVRSVLCPDKLTTGQWLDVMRIAHEAGLRTTSTMMFGHVDEPVHWARHLLRLRTLQAQTRGFTEFVPLPFVPMEAPLYRKGRARAGPTLREAILVHAVARLALHPVITNVQTSWVKLGPDGAAACLAAGANDLGGTLMNESISRAAGASHGQELTPAAAEALIRSIGRTPRPRTTLYADAPASRVEAARSAPPLASTVNTPVRFGDLRKAASPCTT